MSPWLAPRCHPLAHRHEFHTALHGTCEGKLELPFLLRQATLIRLRQLNRRLTTGTELRARTPYSLRGYPERFAQEALGHNSKAVHRAYAKKALMKIPSLQEYEERATIKITL
jgi:hypothetical protein